MQARPRAWNHHEAVILLDGLLNIEQNKIRRKEIVKQVSCDLRQMALNQGETIDEIFRDENGIYFQLQSMESAFKGYTIYKPASKLFIDVVEIYNNDKPKYYKLLKEAHMMVKGENSLKDEFAEYLSSKKSEGHVKEILACCDDIEKQCLRTKVLTKPLFQTKDLATLDAVQKSIWQKNFNKYDNNHRTKMYSAVHYYYVFVKNIQESDEENLIGSTLTETKKEPKQVSTAADNTVIARTDDDKRLLNKYPIVFKRLFNVLKDSHEDLTVYELYEKTKRIARLSDIENILDNVSWAECIGNKYKFSMDTASCDVEGQSKELKNNIIGDSSAENNNCKELIVDFKNLQDLSNTCPLYFFYFGEKSRSFTSWPVLYVHLITILYRNYPKVFSEGMSFSGDKGQKDIERANHAEELVKPKLLQGTSYVIETDGSANILMGKTAYLMKKCKIAFDNIQVIYQVISTEGTELTENVNSGILAENSKYCDEKYEKILRENFKNGFRMNSLIELRRFRKYFENEFNVELKESDNEIANIIEKLCVLINDRAYLLDIVITDELKQQIYNYIDQSFKDGTTVIYYQAICSKFDDELLYSPIYNNVDALREYLSKTGDGRFYIHDNYISKDVIVRVDLLTEIRSCMQAVDRPVGYDELCSMLSHLSKDVIKSILDNNSEFIENGPNEYFDAYCLHISDTEIEDIANLIERSIEDKGFLGGNELYDIVQTKYPDIIDNNSNLSVYGFRDALKYKLGERFTFKGNIISKAGVDLSMSEVFAEFARTHDSFTVDELQVLADDLATQIYFPSVYEYSLRVSQNQFVSKKNIQFPIDEVDYAIDQFCVGNYMAIQDVHNFGAFPYVGFPWNNFMLEHYVADYSKEFRLVDNGFSKTTCVGAIVKRSACIGSFDDLLVDVLVNSNIELNRETALDYLKDMGYLARRTYSNINDIIIRARALKNWKEAD